MTTFTFAVGLLITVGILSSLVPYLTRPDLFFAWTVPAGFRHTSPGKRIIARYLVFGWLGTAAVLLLLMPIPVSMQSAASQGVIVAWLGAFFVGRNLSRPY